MSLYEGGVTFPAGTWGTIVDEHDNGAFEVEVAIPDETVITVSADEIERV